MRRKLFVALIVLALIAVPVFATACEDEVIPGEQEEEEEEEEEEPPLYSAENPLVLKYSYFAASTSPTATDMIIPMGEELER